MYSTILLFLLLIGSSQSEKIEKSEKITKESSATNDLLQAQTGYQFSYSTGNNGPAQIFREEKRTDDGTVIGKYGYVDPNGQLRTVHYTAGTGGFRVTGDTGPDHSSQKEAFKLHHKDESYRQQKDAWDRMKSWGWGTASNWYTPPAEPPTPAPPSNPSVYNGQYGNQRQINWDNWDHNKNWNNWNNWNSQFQQYPQWAQNFNWGSTFGAEQSWPTIPQHGSNPFGNAPYTFFSINHGPGDAQQPYNYQYAY